MILSPGEIFLLQNEKKPFTDINSLKALKGGLQGPRKVQGSSFLGPGSGTCV